MNNVGSYGAYPSAGQLQGRTFFLGWNYVRLQRRLVNSRRMPQENEDVGIPCCDVVNFSDKRKRSRRDESSVRCLGKESKVLKVPANGALEECCPQEELSACSKVDRNCENRCGPIFSPKKASPHRKMIAPIPRPVVTLTQPLSVTKLKTPDPAILTSPGGLSLASTIADSSPLSYVEAQQNEAVVTSDRTSNASPVVKSSGTFTSRRCSTAPVSPIGGLGEGKQSQLEGRGTAECNAPSTVQCDVSLPVYGRRRDIIDAVAQNQVTIIIGETGSGKTTQVPQMLLREWNEQLFRERFHQVPAPWPSPTNYSAASNLPGCKSDSSNLQGELNEAIKNGETYKSNKVRRSIPVLAVTEPRRVAAVRLAARVADEIRTRAESQQENMHFPIGLKELGEASSCPKSMWQVGGVVGYSVRFMQKCSGSTQIKFLTDGMILREAMLDPALRLYRCVVVDEAHERSLRTDILLGLLKNLLQKRKNFRVVVMSATLDYAAFTAFFGQGKVIVLPGRQFPVTIFHSVKSNEEYMEDLIATVTQIHLAQSDAGAILVFLPGQEEIRLARQLLQKKAVALNEARLSFVRWGGIFGRVLHLLKNHADSCRIAKSQEVAQPSLISARLLTTIADIFVNDFAGLTAKHSDKEEGRDQVAQEIVDAISKANSAGQAMDIVQSTIAHLSLDIAVPNDNVQAYGATDADGQKRGLNIAARFADCTSRKPEWKDMLILPFFAAMPLEEQDIVFKPTPPNIRKIVLATNVAETSVTIPGVRYVVDSGLCKVKKFNPRNNVESLIVRPISRAMANQRSGRAGREGPGKSYRLYTEREYFTMDTQVDPEIKRSNLSQTVLELKSLGVQKLEEFPFISKASDAALEKAVASLKQIGALNQAEEITPIGKQLAVLPLDPEFGKFLINSVRCGCTAEALTIVAALNSESIWTFSNSSNASKESGTEKTCVEAARRRLLCTYGDHLTIVNAFNFWEDAGFDRLALCKTYGLSHLALVKLKSIRTQLKNILLSDQSFGLTHISSCLAGGNTDIDAVRRCLALSFPFKVARLALAEEQRGSKETVAVSRYIIEALPDASICSRQSFQPPFIRPPVYSLVPKTSRSKALLKLSPELRRYVVFSELIETSKLYMRYVTAIEGQWLKGVCRPQSCTWSNNQKESQLSITTACSSREMSQGKLFKSMRIGSILVDPAPRLCVGQRH